MTFDLSSSIGADLGILVKIGSVPTPEDYDYKQDAPGDTAESLTVNVTNKSSAPLYVLAYNNSDFATPYTLLATEAPPLAFLDVEQVESSLILTFTSVAGSTYTVQVSSDFILWSDLKTVTADSDSTTVTDSSSSAEPSIRTAR